MAEIMIFKQTTRGPDRNELSATSYFPGRGKGESGSALAKCARWGDYSLYGYSFAVKISAARRSANPRKQSTVDDTYGNCFARIRVDRRPGLGNDQETASRLGI